MNPKDNSLAHKSQQFKNETTLGTLLMGHNILNPQFVTAITKPHTKPHIIQLHFQIQAPNPQPRHTHASGKMRFWNTKHPHKGNENHAVPKKYDLVQLQIMQFQKSCSSKYDLVQSGRYQKKCHNVMGENCTPGIQNKTQIGLTGKR